MNMNYRLPLCLMANYVVNTKCQSNQKMTQESRNVGAAKLDQGFFEVIFNMQLQKDLVLP